MRRLLPIIVVAAAFAVGTYIGYVRTRPTPKVTGPTLAVAFLDAGLGSGVLVTTPDGRFLVIDPGPERTAESLADFLTAKGAREFAVLISNPISDHVGSTEKLAALFRLTRFHRGEREGTSALFRKARQAIRSRGIPEVVLAAGDVVDLGSGVKLEVLSPPRGLIKSTANRRDDNSLVTRLRFGQKRLLLMSDARNAAEGYLIRSCSDLAADVLAVGRHGRAGSTSIELLSVVRPQFCVVNVGTGSNRPARQTLATIGTRNTGAAVYRTDESGAITAITDGRSVEVTADKEW